MTSASPDALTLLTQHAASLDSITYTTAQGTAADDVSSSTFIVFPSHPDTPIPRSTKTRAVRSRNSPVLQPDSLATPEQDHDDFLALDALIFLLQTKDEAVGLYAVKATREKVARVDTLDRPILLDFLLGKKTESECEVVLSLAQCQARQGSATAVSSAPQQLAAQDAQTQEAQADDNVSSTAPSSTLHPLLAGGKRPYAPSKQDAAFVKRLRSAEVVLRDRAWAFRCQKPSSADRYAADDDDDDEEGEYTAGAVNGNGASAPGSSSSTSRDVDFTTLRRSVQGRIADLKRGGTGSGNGSATTSSSQPSASSTPSAASTSTLGRSQRHRRLDPIIILPSSPSSLLTLSNIKAFLEEGKFIPPSSASTLAPTGGSNEVVVINRPKGGRFLAIDSLDALNRLGGGAAGASTGNDPWRRVACIVTTGQKWQFKGYRWEEGRELFRNGE